MSREPTRWPSSKHPTRPRLLIFTWLAQGATPITQLLCREFGPWSLNPPPPPPPPPRRSHLVPTVKADETGHADPVVQWGRGELFLRRSTRNPVIELIIESSKANPHPGQPYARGRPGPTGDLLSTTSTGGVASCARRDPPCPSDGGSRLGCHVRSLGVGLALTWLSPRLIGAGLPMDVYSRRLLFDGRYRRRSCDEPGDPDRGRSNLRGGANLAIPSGAKLIDLSRARCYPA